MSTLTILCITRKLHCGIKFTQLPTGGGCTCQGVYLVPGGVPARGGVPGPEGVPGPKGGCTWS